MRGWAVGAGSAVESVELLHDGGVLARSTPDVPRPDIEQSLPDVPAEQQVGFFLSINALALELDFELQLRALLRDGETVELATLSGRRSPLDSGYRARLQPLMVTTIGRTGSSMLVHLLGAHPGVVAYRPFRVEPRVASYWIGVLRSLSEPASYRRQMQGLNLQNPTWWLGTEGRVARRTQDAEFQDWLGSEAVQTLAGFAQSRIDDVYTRIAGLQQRPDVAYFAEKYQPDAVPRLMWELYPDAREVVLVRDFRDMLCSILAFNAKRGVQGFGRDRAASDAEFVDEMGKPADALARSWEQRASRAHLIRYEDLVSRPAETVEGLLDYAGLDSGRSGRAGNARRAGPGGRRGHQAPHHQRRSRRVDRPLARGARSRAAGALRAGLRAGARGLRLSGRGALRIAVRTVLFHRNFPRFSGGALKVWDYFNHILSAPGYNALIKFAPGSTWDESNPWSNAREHVLEPDADVRPDMLFLAGNDWLQLPEAERDESPVPVINYVAHVRHADPDDHLGRYDFLAHKAIRICMSYEVEEAILATGRVRGPTFAIPGSIDFDEVLGGREGRERDIDLLIVANKRPRLGRRLAARLQRPGRRLHLIDRLVLRSDALDLVSRARVTLFLPNRKEGFFLPALEGMALGTIVVCPDCIGNRSFCLDGVNCFRPDYVEDRMVEAAESALAEAPGLGAMLEAGAEMARRHDLQGRETRLPGDPRQGGRALGKRLSR